jgi:hypothetical protein
LTNNEGKNKTCKCEIWADLVENHFPNDMSWTPVDPKGGKSHISECVERDLLEDLGDLGKDASKMGKETGFDDDGTITPDRTVEGDREIAQGTGNGSYVYSEGKGLSAIGPNGDKDKSADGVAVPEMVLRKTVSIPDAEGKNGLQLPGKHRPLTPVRFPSKKILGE